MLRRPACPLLSAEHLAHLSLSGQWGYTARQDTIVPLLQTKVRC
jgi:hypothetical protein